MEVGVPVISCTVGGIFVLSISISLISGRLQLEDGSGRDSEARKRTLQVKTIQAQKMSANVLFPFLQWEEDINNMWRRSSRLSTKGIHPCVYALECVAKRIVNIIPFGGTGVIRDGLSSDYAIQCAREGLSPPISISKRLCQESDEFQSIQKYASFGILCFTV